MEAADHLGFIVAAYAAAAAVVLALFAWVALDYQAQRRALADLERRGFSRRSEPMRSAPAIEQATLEQATLEQAKEGA
jgi:heme exporter protein D